MLRIPGPTPCPEQVLRALSRQMINHRGDEFKEILLRVTQRLKEFFQTKGDMLILTSSGTGGLEAAVVNTLSPGEKVLGICGGVFGERFASIAERFGADVRRLNFPWGQPADPEAIAQALDSDPGIKAVLVTHNETSTGLTNDLASIAKVVKERGKLLLVDAISSLGCIELQSDAWGCDVVVTGSQKGWMVPPGLAFVSLSQEAWEANRKAQMPRFYWDFSVAKKYLEIGQTPWTPAISVFYALDVSLDLIAQEGLQNVFARHARVGRKAREGVKELGLQLFAEESHASNTVTAVNLPGGIDGRELLRKMREEHGVVLAGGQQELAGKIFRIGHLGWVQEGDIEKVLEKLRLVLTELGFTSRE